MDGYNRAMTRSSLPASESAPSVASVGIDARWTTLLRAFGAVLGDSIEHDSGPDRAVERMSRTVMPLVPHDWMDFALTEGDRGLYRRMRAKAEQSIGDVPGVQPPIEEPALVAVLHDGTELHEPARIVVPLRLGERIVGYFELRHRGAWAYRADHLAAARIIADLSAPAGATMHLYKLEEWTRRRLATVIEIGRAMGQSLDLDEILPSVGRALLETLHLSRCDIYLPDETRRALILLARLGNPPAGSDLPRRSTTRRSSTRCSMLASRS